MAPIKLLPRVVCPLDTVRIPRMQIGLFNVFCAELHRLHRLPSPVDLRPQYQRVWWLGVPIPNKLKKHFCYYVPAMNRPNDGRGTTQCRVLIEKQAKHTRSRWRWWWWRRWCWWKKRERPMTMMVKDNGTKPMITRFRWRCVAHILKSQAGESRDQQCTMNIGQGAPCWTFRQAWKQQQHDS